MWATLKTFKGGFLGAILALALGLVGLHLWMDHLALHAVFERVVAAQQQAPK